MISDIQYTFKQITDESGNVVEFTINDAFTWGDLADRFFEFLRGAGFILERTDLAEHYNEEL